MTSKRSSRGRSRGLAGLDLSRSLNLHDDVDDSTQRIPNSESRPLNNNKTVSKTVRFADDDNIIFAPPRVINTVEHSGQTADTKSVEAVVDTSSSNLDTGFSSSSGPVATGQSKEEKHELVLGIDYPGFGIYKCTHVDPILKTSCLNIFTSTFAWKDYGKKCSKCSQFVKPSTLSANYFFVCETKDCNTHLFKWKGPTVHCKGCNKPGKMFCTEPQQMEYYNKIVKKEKIIARQVTSSYATPGHKSSCEKCQVDGNCIQSVKYPSK